MSHLEGLKERLKRKPDVHPNEGVRVILAPVDAKMGMADAKMGMADTKKTFITAEKDEGKRAQDILERIKQKKLSTVVKRFPEETARPLSQIKADEIPINEKKKPKKLKKDVVILEEEQEIVPEPLPEGGPRLEEEMDEHVNNNNNNDNNNNEMVEENADHVAIKPRKRTTKKATKGVIELGPELMIKIGDTSIEKRLPPIPVFDMKVSSYYMSNREIFVNFINGLFEPYKEDLLDETKGISCEDIGKDTGEIGLLTHQKIVRDYINLYTPYRGLLLYHGLGSGKTCSSIAIAEGMKSARKIIIMTPASLRRNYIEEIKKCGDLLFRKNQYWEWISINDNQSFVDPLSAALGLPREYIRRNHGAWLVNIRKPSNYKDLSSSDKKILNDQIDEMIRNKYTFINYNGLRRDRFKELTNNFTNNIFDDAVVIIDEAHNLISRIVNKINNMSKFSEKKRGPDSLLPNSLALLLYEFLLNASNSRVVLLTGTPIINYPNEIGILFNILRGYIKTWSFTLNVETSKKLSKDSLQEIFNREKVLDYIDYTPSSKTLTVTRNPYGFENKITQSGYKGVTNEKKEKRNDKGEIEHDTKGHIIYDERGQISDKDFIHRIVKVLKKNNITALANGTNYSVNTALPDTLDEFVNLFINKDTGNITNTDKFKRRIVGLTSYFRSAQEELLPSYDRNFDRHEVLIPMSDYQFNIYETYRQDERKSEKSQGKSSGTVDVDGLFKEPSSTYRIFSRLACNFVMPKPPGRPNPTEYRATALAKKGENMLKWLKEKYFKDKETVDPDFQFKYDEFIADIPQDILDKHQTSIKHVLELYMKEYLEQKYNGTIRSFGEQTEFAWIFNEKMSKEKITNATKAISQLQEKADAKISQLQEKIDKNQKKIAKEEAKRLKEEEKAEAKRLKEEEKAEAKRLKDEEKAAKKLKKGGSNDSESESEESDLEDDILEDDDLEGGGKSQMMENPVEEFVDDHINDEVSVVHLNEYKDEDAILREIDELEADELLENMGNVEYKEAIKSSMKYLQIHSQEFLSPEGLKIYSPKFLAMLDNIDDTEHQGLHLVYSQFRSMEGIGIFCLVLEANGFAKFKIKRNNADGWDINMSEEDMGKPCYALYTGTEDAEEREILRNIYNGMWDYIPNNIATQLRAKSSNNNLGEIVKVLMITSAGSEGINLRNTRYVHIMEPYWHPVRIEQVIGRARRICSHQGLPKELQTVEVFIYIMTITQQQLNSEFAIELKLKDRSKKSPFLPQSSDEKLFEISTIKEQLTSQLLRAVKESSIDCATHIKASTKEGLVCLSFGRPTTGDFSYNPNFAQDENDTVANLNREKIDWDARPFTFKATGKRYMLRMDTKQVYDYDSVIQAKEVSGVRPILIGKLVKNNKGDYEIVKERV